MQIKTLMPFAHGSDNLGRGEIVDYPAAVANALISAGLAEQVPDVEALSVAEPVATDESPAAGAGKAAPRRSDKAAPPVDDKGA